MPRPVTTSEVLLQQIADSLVEIRDLLQQPSTTPDTTGADTGPVEVRGQADGPDAASPAPGTKTEPAAAPKRQARRKTTAKKASAKKTSNTSSSVTGD